jgi:hypothetical protein
MKCARCNSKEFHIENMKRAKQASYTQNLVSNRLKANKRELLLFIHYQTFNSKKYMSKYF